MASTACSSTCIAGGEILVPPQELRKKRRPPNLCGGVIVASYASFHGHICVAKKKHLFPAKAVQRVPTFYKENGLNPERVKFQLPEKSNFKAWYLEKQCKLLIKAVATVEPYCLITSENYFMDDSSLWFDSSPDSQMAQSSVDLLELDERETLRRMRISNANKGNIPWNKGRKHSPETLQKIRERTKLAMQDPKVKRKLMNLGHAQSDDTKKKIAVGVRQGWRRRRKILTVQQKCIFEWQNMIAKAARKGYAGEVELQWDSYKVINEQLKQEWLESIEKRKSMPRPKGSKRTPKSLEQRRKISESISAKWADPEYRDRVHAALAKYHGTVIGSNKKQRRKPTGETSEKGAISKKSEQTAQLNFELKNIKQETYKKRRNSAPSYKDPMSSVKLDLLKKIKADRAEMESKKREATRRAKLLIAEAERAAEALEAAALNSPLAKASLLETRKLIAEANLSLQTIEREPFMSYESEVDSYFNSNSDGLEKHLQTNTTATINQSMLTEKLVNGFPNPSSFENGDEINQHEMSCGIDAEEGFIASQDQLLPSHHLKRIESDRAETVDSRKRNDPKIVSAKTRKWVCGRFVEVED
ncbi:uncharacterized protein LOC110020768 [Phalaenopsis equestris]|uniref:uncharacterized protein LOC110020768 n=1 Tax=Phalaenopsis equestris TaxID=78828 RepID=UPI0009E346CD|nr:uncharacterized protein LOC110020768 [Phalaenopsis equestris]